MSKDGRLNKDHGAPGCISIAGGIAVVILAILWLIFIYGLNQPLLP